MVVIGLLLTVFGITPMRGWAAILHKGTNHGFFMTPLQGWWRIIQDPHGVAPHLYYEGPQEIVEWHRRHRTRWEASCQQAGWRREV